MHQKSELEIKEAKQTELKGKIDKHVIIAEGFNIPLWKPYRTCRWKTSKNTEKLNNTSNKLDLTDIYWTSNIRVHIQVPTGTWSLYSGSRENIKNFKIIEIIPSVFLTIMKLNYNSITERYQNDLQYLELNNTLLNNPPIKEEVSMDISKYFQMNKNANTKYQNLCGIGKVLRKNVLS